MGKILVTGATGFTGGHLAKRLVDDGEKVVTFVRPSSRTETLVDLGVECRTVDIKDRHAVCNGFDDIDRVYHLAAAYRTEHSDPSEFRLVNVEATRNLLEASCKAKVKRFVHCSTVGVQGEINDPPADENYRFSPGDHYQESKLEGERLAADYFSKGLCGAIVRPVGIYGPGDRRFLKLFRPISRSYFVMIGSGETLYHLTYISDLVDGFVCAGNHPNAVGEVFTIGGEGYTTLRNIVNLIADILDKPRPRWRIPYPPVYWASVACDRVGKILKINPPLYPRRVEFFVKDRAFSIEKAKSTIGYLPRVGLKEGLRRTADWYRQEGLI
jgi:nucleoside-diphosphate-sugar epimerase